MASHDRGLRLINSITDLSHVSAFPAKYQAHPFFPLQPRAIAPLCGDPGGQAPSVNRSMVVRASRYVTQITCKV